MKRYVFQVQGLGCHLTVDGRKVESFYTTRWADAEEESEARRKTLAAVLQELRNTFGPDAVTGALQAELKAEISPSENPEFANSGFAFVATEPESPAILRQWEWIRILGFCVLAAVVYGIAHDLVTANLCVEYFSVFHIDLFHTDSPWLLALGWGVVATWWMGFFLGTLITAAARAGELPKLGWRDLVKPIGLMLACSYGIAMGAGTVGYSRSGELPNWILTMAPDLADLPPSKRPWFMFDLFAHNASYFLTALGAIGVCVWVIRMRLKRFVPPVERKVLAP